MDDRAELWTLHKAAIDDRNFQVTLNWDRTKHFFLVNAALATVATAMSGAGERYRGYLLAVVAVNSMFGAFSIWRGHGYYRAARKRLADIERRLGLGELGTLTTAGMVREHAQRPRTLREAFTVTNLQIALQLVVAVLASLASASFLAR